MTGTSQHYLVEAIRSQLSFKNFNTDLEVLLYVMHESGISPLQLPTGDFLGTLTSTLSLNMQDCKPLCIAMRVKKGGQGLALGRTYAIACADHSHWDSAA